MDADHLGANLPPYDRHALFTTWSAHPGWLVVGALILIGYLWAVRRAGANGTPHPAWRVASFVIGVLTTEVTIASAIDAYAMQLFWVHMVEHLILIMVVPIFLVLGHPLTVIRNALRGPARERADAVLASRVVGVLTDPLVGLLAYTVVIVGTHLTGFMDQMAMHSWVMTFEQVLYIVAGCWLFLPLVAFEPIRRNVTYMLRLAVLFGAMVPDAVVGIVLLQTDDNLFPMMFSMHQPWAMSPVRDLNTAGALMWAGGDGLMMFIAVGVMLAMISDRDQTHQGFGTWLEGARQRTLIQHVNLPGDDVIEGEIDPDGEEALAAYNRMLGRLSEE